MLSKQGSGLSETCASLFYSNFLSSHYPVELRLLGGTRASAVVWGWGEGSLFSGGWLLWAEEAHSEQECRGPKPRVELNSCSPWACAHHAGIQAQALDEGPEVCRTWKSGNALLVESESIRLASLYASCTKSICHLLARGQVGRKSYREYNSKQTFLLSQEGRCAWFGSREASVLPALSAEAVPFPGPLCVTADGSGAWVMEMVSSRHSRFVAMLFLSPLLTSVTGKDLRLFLNLCLLISTWQLA